MELVFLILKTAGIVLLVILGLVLLLAALLLFVPVRYQAEGELPETAGPAARGATRVRPHARPRGSPPPGHARPLTPRREAGAATLPAPKRAVLRAGPSPASAIL